MKKFLSILTFLVFFIVPSYVNAQWYVNDVVITSPTGIWTDNRAFTTLSDAISAIGANEQTLVVASAQTVTSLTVPSNITLDFKSSGAINNSGVLNIQSTQIIAPSGKQIFTGTGDIDVANGTNVRSSWFGGLNYALECMEDDYAILIVDSGWAGNVSANRTVGDNVTLKFEGAGNRIVINSGFTLSNIKNIDSGNYTIFGGSGSLNFLDGSELNLSWFDTLPRALVYIGSAEADLNINETVSLSTSETVPENIKLNISKGSLFDIAAGQTLTIYSPANIIAANNQQIFDGESDGVAFSESGIVHAQWYSGTDIGAKINYASRSLPSNGGTVDVGYFATRQEFSTTILWSAYVNIDFSRSKLLYTGTGSALVTAKIDRVTANTQADGSAVVDATLIEPDIQANGVCADVFYLLGFQNCDIIRPRIEKITADAQASKSLISLVSGDSAGSGGPGGVFYNTIDHPILIGGTSSNQRIANGINLFNLGTLGIVDNEINRAKITYTSTNGIKTADDYARDNTFYKPSLEGIGGASDAAGTGIYEEGTRNAYIFPYGENLQYGIDRQATAAEMWLIGENFQSSVPTKLNAAHTADTYIVRGWDTELPFTIGNSAGVPVEIRQAFKAGGQPSVTVHINGDLAVGSAAGYVTLDLGDEDFDLNDDFDTETYTFTAPWAGRYQISINVAWTDGLTDQDKLSLRVLKNGSTDVWNHIMNANGTTAQTQFFTTVLNLAASDTLIFQASSPTNNNDIKGGNAFTWVNIVQLN